MGGTKKGASVRVKKEPVSPPKKGGKRPITEVIDLSDANPESEDDARSAAPIPGPSTASYPVVEIPIARRSTRKGSKRARADTPGDADLISVLRTQFNIVADAFRGMAEAIEKSRGE